MPSSDFYVNGAIQVGTLQPIFWGSRFGGGMAGPVNTDPPPAYPNRVASSLAAYNVGGLLYNFHQVGLSTGGVTAQMLFYVPVPAGATSVVSVSMDRQIVAVAGGIAGASLRYEPLNGGAPALVSTGGAVPDPGLVTMNIPGPFAPPTPGHFIQIVYGTTLNPGATNAQVNYTRLVIGWR
jgi:hypothetical protein